MSVFFGEQHRLKNEDAKFQFVQFLQMRPPICPHTVNAETAAKRQKNVLHLLSCCVVFPLFMASHFDKNCDIAMHLSAALDTPRLC